LVTGDELEKSYGGRGGKGPRSAVSMNRLDLSGKIKSLGANTKWLILRERSGLSRKGIEVEWHFRIGKTQFGWKGLGLGLGGEIIHPTRRKVSQPWSTRRGNLGGRGPSSLSRGKPKGQTPKSRIQMTENIRWSRGGA